MTDENEYKLDIEYVGKNSTTVKFLEERVEEFNRYYKLGVDPNRYDARGIHVYGTILKPENPENPDTPPDIVTVICSRGNARITRIERKENSSESIESRVIVSSYKGIELILSGYKYKIFFDK